VQGILETINMYYYLKFHLSASILFIILHEPDGISSDHYLIICNHDIVYSSTKQLFFFCRKMSWQGSLYGELTKLCILVENSGYFSLYKWDIFIEKLLDMINSNNTLFVPEMEEDVL
jgi:hypothetical protein